MQHSDDTLHPVAISQVMLNFAQRNGIDQQICLLGTGISETELSSGEGLVTRTQEMRLIENLMLALPEAGVGGFELGLQYNLATFGVWGFALRTCKTLREAVALGLRYLPLSTAYCCITVCEDGEAFGVVFDPDPIPPHLRQFLLERDMATALNLVREITFQGVEFKGVEFTGEPDVSASAIESLCGIAPAFHASANRILVNRAGAGQPFPGYDPVLTRMLEQQCQKRMDTVENSGLAGKVRQKLLGELGLGATLNDMASELALSTRSLRRKLEQEGASYRDLVEEERRQLALQLLNTTTMKIEELAAHLGYTDAGGFVRAFRRWQGCSPSAYREKA
ncbi:AraC family transcriptional regulator [Alcanivorax sp. HI0083]|nr:MULTISPECIES: AraC family transcriptional regulator [unclassified Alcanivorax]KZY38691.1 AraC family transcriptional regulator [Alcanivorax sp. HI0044]KZZ26813.1 AraC family transcriptional regulator [Alcanivorax sp. HI0083]